MKVNQFEQSKRGKDLSMATLALKIKSYSLLLFSVLYIYFFFFIAKRWEY